MTDPEKAETAELPALTDEQVELQRLRDENAALHKKIDAAHKIAEEMDDAQRDEDDLKERAKAAKARKDQLADALAALVRGDVQTEVGEIVGPMANQQPINGTPQEVEARRNAGDVLELGPGVIEWAELEVAALSHLFSTGKPQTVKPVLFMGKHYVAVDVTDRIVSLLPILSFDEFKERHGTGPVEIPSDARSADLEALGPHAGIPVKVKRKIYHLAPDKEALLVKMPEEVKVGAVADGGPGWGRAESDDADACIDYGLITNRIRAHIESLPDNGDNECRRVSEVAKALSLAPATVHLVCWVALAAAEPSLSFYDAYEDNPIIEV